MDYGDVWNKMLWCWKWT